MLRFEKEITNSREIKQRDNKNHFDRIKKDQILETEEKQKLQDQKKDLKEYLQLQIMQKTADKILKKHLVDHENAEVKRTLGPDLPTTE